MSESLIALALTMHSKKGTFALLLGSGISRAAEVPTGWEILLDLIKRLAAASGDSEVDDLEAWYEDKFGESPNYSVILEALGKTAAERQGIIE